MVQIYFSSNHFSIALFDEIVACTLDRSHNSWELKRTLQVANFVKKTAEDCSIQCCSFSPCGEYFAVCYDKDLIVFDTEDWNVYCSVVTDRKGQSVRFFPKSNNILLADRSGNVTFYEFSKNTLQRNDLVLGHNSMLTGGLITDDEKFVITCDRDEKIRVSNFPNVYSIESYCLGHEQFISNIELLPTDNRVLVSASGDGTVRFWDFVKGEQVSLFSNSQDLKAPLVKVTCVKKDKILSLAAVQVYKSTQIIFLNVKGNLDSKIDVQFIRLLKTIFIPLDIAFWDENLVYILPVENSSLKKSVAGDVLSDENSGFSSVSGYLSKTLLNNCKKASDTLAVLFKREIDNVQEYHQKKKARLLKNCSTNQMEMDCST